MGRRLDCIIKWCKAVSVCDESNIISFTNMTHNAIKCVFLQMASKFICNSLFLPCLEFVLPLVSWFALACNCHVLCVFTNDVSVACSIGMASRILSSTSVIVACKTTITLYRRNRAGITSMYDSVTSSSVTEAVRGCRSM